MTAWKRDRPITIPLCMQDNTNVEKLHTYVRAPSGFRTVTPALEWYKARHATDLVVPVVAKYLLISTRHMYTSTNNKRISYDDSVKNIVRCPQM